MPFIAPIIGAVVGAVGGVISAVGATVGALGAAVGLGGVGASIAGIGAATSEFGALIGMGASLSALGAVAAVGIAAGGIALAVGIASLLAQPQLDSQAIPFKADINAGIPIVIGRTGVGGNIVFVDTSTDANNKWLHYVVVLSHGPITQIEKFYANNVPVVFNGSDPYQAIYVGLNFLGAWSGTYDYQIDDGVSELGTDYIATAPSLNIAPPNASYWQSITINTGHAWLNKMWQSTRLGAQPDTALPAPSAAGSVPEFDSAHILSGLACARWCLVADATAYGAGTPKPTWVVWGPAVYDPRLDSTYPGGSGSQRWNDETTWAYSDNPFLHGLAWIIGRKNNGVKVLGLGLPIGAIDLPAFVAGANVADANGWKVGGQVFSTDSKWDVLTAMLQAGCGAPTRLAARISCLVNTPLVSIATLIGADAIGPVSVQATTSRKDRINRVIPTYRSEPNDWQQVQAAAVAVSSYATADGGVRTKSINYQLVQDVDQASQLARYAIEDAREFGPIVLPLTPQWMGLQPGDGITVTEPEWGMNGQLCLVVDRKIDPTLGAPTITLRSETTAKHSFALGQTGTAPPTPTLTGVDLTVTPPPGSGVWTAAGTTLTQSGQAVPAIVVTGAIDNPTADAIVVEYAVHSSGVWSHLAAAPSATRIQIVDVAPSTQYDVRIRYVRNGAVSAATTATGSPVTTGAAVANTIVNQGALATINQANTANIVNNAVTSPNNALTAGTQSFQSASPTTVQSLSITTAGGVVKLTVSLQHWTGTGSWPLTIQCYRGGTLLYEFDTESDVGPLLDTFSLQDTPSAGTYTYTLVLTTPNFVNIPPPNGTQFVAYAYLDALEVKK